MADALLCPSYTFHDGFLAFLPGFLVPDNSFPYFLSAILLIAFCSFTTTYNHPALPYLRLLSAVPISFSLWEYGFSPQFDEPGRNRQADMAMAVVTAYGLLKVVEICLVGFWNKPKDWPQWIRRDNGKKDDEGEGPVVIPPGPSVGGRAFYGLDLLSICGSSWKGDRIWSFAPRSMFEWKMPTKSVFLRQRIIGLIQLYLIVDILESFSSEIKWDTRNPRPLTGTLPIHLQLFYTFVLGGRTIASMLVPYYFHSIWTVALGISPSAWPPVFQEPFAATGLQDFWSFRWHTSYRRAFHEISRGLLALLPTSYIKFHPRFIKFLRSFIAFGLSMVLHLLFMCALPNDEAHPYEGLFNTQIMKCFLLQPFGVLMEFAVIMPLTKNMPERQKLFIRRLFGWSWMLWTGRYWVDVWIHRGLWGTKERWILFSPVRKVLYGTWTPC
ncbi:hypothetical protein FRC02_009168 [Tulasnella sp. 418]|nr:hypothetical protein FRC02_009168 [Tulasnella sp. 418]